MDLVLSVDSAGVGGLDTYALLQMLYEEQCQEVFRYYWSVDDRTLDKLLSAKYFQLKLHVFDARGEEDVIGKYSDAVLSVGLNHGNMWMNVGGKSIHAIREAVAAVKKLFPESKPKDSNTIWLSFHSLGPRGPQLIRREIVVPTWSEVAANYPGETGSMLTELMSDFRPETGGQLMLWHGDPGTGKTWAIRALGREWKQWCNLEYITDPETFFGDAYYMMQVLMNIGSSNEPKEVEAATNYGAGEGKGTVENYVAPWHLLILEDTGELLSADAKERSGQGLSRFLNLVDGLIGQGLQVLLLVTTNEPVRELHPAVSRPGRCVANVEFEKFNQDGASKWLSTRTAEGMDQHIDVIHGSLTIADLYSMLHGQKTRVKSRREVGFRGKR